MQKYIIHGGHPLFGEVEISGAKTPLSQSFLPPCWWMGPASENCIPQISDVTVVLEILQGIGCRCAHRQQKHI